MKIASIAEIKSKFSKYINESKKGAVIITKNGKPTAAIISIKDEEDLERIIISQSKILNDIFKKAEKRIKSGKGISHDEFWSDLEKKIK